jgi:hypothetical protein
MPDNALLQAILIGVAGLFGVGLVYFVFIGVRGLFRQARRIASGAGHLQSAAAWRAILRMAVWAVFFGVFYLFLYFLGLRLGWWALIPCAIGLVGMIWGLLQADRLLIVRSDDVRQQVGIAATLTGLIAGFVSIIWFAAAHGS